MKEKDDVIYFVSVLERFSDEKMSKYILNKDRTKKAKSEKTTIKEDKHKRGL